MARLLTSAVMALAVAQNAHAETDCPDTPTDHFFVIQYRRAQGNTLASADGMTEENCAIRCVNRPECLAFNYKAETQHCDLKTLAAPDAPLSVNSHWTYHIRSFLHCGSTPASAVADEEADKNLGGDEGGAEGSYADEADEADEAGPDENADPSPAEQEDTTTTEEPDASGSGLGADRANAGSSSGKNKGKKKNKGSPKTSKKAKKMSSATLSMDASTYGIVAGASCLSLAVTLFAFHKYRRSTIERQVEEEAMEYTPLL
eukprot:m.436403 g.436403  ORF g.436403 m.436403 type:complete len:260 (-) comp17969_c0_seq1:104-883(-)